MHCPAGVTLPAISGPQSSQEGALSLSEELESHAIAIREEWEADVQPLLCYPLAHEFEVLPGEPE